MIGRPPHARAVTRGPRHHWFGYYEKCPWSADGKLMLAMEVDFIDRLPTGAEAVRVGLIDLEAGDGRFHPLDETRTWSWQQGCMLQWLGSDPNRLIVYNSIVDGQGVAIVRDIHSGSTRTLPRPVSAISADGTQALSLSFGRLARTRPACGYPALVDPYADVPHPDGDGIWWMDLRTGETRLIVSLDQITRIDHRCSFANEGWFNHTLFNPAGSRFLWLHRWRRHPGGTYLTRLLTADPDGSAIHSLVDDRFASHFAWRDDRHLLAWAEHRELGRGYFLYRDRTPGLSVVGPDVLTTDGHCSYSPDPARRYILTDTYPVGRPIRTLLLYDTQTGQRADLGDFLSPPRYRGDIRCDLHPRWSRDGRQVCFDSLHEGERQVYVLDVSAIVEYR